MPESLILLALGWLAGVLSPALIESIRRHREATHVLAAVKNELNEVAFRLVLASYRVQQHFGTADREYLKWVQGSLVLYQGSEPTENIRKFIEVQLSWSDAQLQQHLAAEAGKDEAAMNLPKFTLPYSDARVPGWHHIPPAVRIGLLAVQTDMNLINDAVELSRTYLSLTFQDLGSNHAPVVKNLQDAYVQYGKRCRIAAQRMHTLHALL